MVIVIGLLPYYELDRSKQLKIEKWMETCIQIWSINVLFPSNRNKIIKLKMS